MGILGGRILFFGPEFKGFRFSSFRLCRFWTRFDAAVGWPAVQPVAPTLDGDDLGVVKEAVEGRRWLPVGSDCGRAHGAGGGGTAPQKPKVLTRF